MDPLTLAFVGMGVVLVLVVFGMPIAFVTAAVGFGGLIALRGLEPAGMLAGTAPHSEASSYTLVVIPFFIMMGSFATAAGITTDLYRMAKAWLGHLPGGLAIATTWGTALWSAISGSSTATAAVMGRMAVPEMLAQGYDRRLAAGSVAAGAAMDALIPPSVVMIVYGLLTESSIGPLLIAGFIPGFMEAFTFAAVIYVMALRNPALAPRVAPAPWGERTRALFRAGNWSFISIFVAVFGGIYFGVFTPTEAGAIGAFGTFLTALALGRLNRHTLVDGLLETGKVSVMIFIIIAGVLIFSRFLAFSGFTQTATDFITGLGLPPMLILIGFLVVYLILGCFLDAIGMMALTLPIFGPIVEKLGFDMIWFGILVVKMIEIALITPPVGLNVYVLRGQLRDVPTADIFRGTLPFLWVQFANVALIMLFPELVLWLPRTMGLTQ
ncbi:MAG TPA: TRAP transporter large permease [Candidatus Tectomicrobia bacterium]|nr:TRAP transporter large permease [Candidatus Tectomicrobia bacterium]